MSSDSENQYSNWRQTLNEQIKVHLLLYNWIWLIDFSFIPFRAMTSIFHLAIYIDIIQYIRLVSIHRYDFPVTIDCILHTVAEIILDKLSVGVLALCSAFVFYIHSWSWARYAHKMQTRKHHTHASNSAYIQNSRTHSQGYLFSASTTTHLSGEILAKNDFSFFSFFPFIF